MADEWRAGIFHGAPKTLRQGISPDAARDVMIQAIEQGAPRAADEVAARIEKRYGTQFSVLFGAIILTAAATTLLAILALTKEG